MTQHPDLAQEQAYVDHAYDCLERTRQDAWKLRNLTEAGLGGTFQARYEREVFDEALVTRLTQLDLGQAALVFGRIDRAGEAGLDGLDGQGVESYHIGRLAVADEEREPVVIDWRAPVAEPFYRATGRDPMGLARRRHFATKGRQLLAIEDELFGEGHLGVTGEGGLSGYSTLLAALETRRTGQLGDIVGTIQAQQDEVIRSPQPGVLVVQGGPGTGKTVVALHRAAYLLYTYRFPLEDQGVLVVGPNRVFLRYIDQVLPSLGEAGVELVVLADLVPDVELGAADSRQGARVKGDARMARVLAKAVHDRERPLREDLVVPYGVTALRLTVAESDRIVKAARRRFRRHNAARRFVETEVFTALAASSRIETTPDDVRERTRHLDEVRETFERMWPVLTPAELLHDLFGSRALLRLAASKWLTDDEWIALHRPRHTNGQPALWSEADLALLDEARELLGPRANRSANGSEGEIRTYGHIVVDEVQDLTPMQLRMVARRSLNGSMTVVGDIAQATGPFAPDDWNEVLAHLPDRRPARIVGLTIGYRIPGQIMAMANRILRVAAPQVPPPDAVREGDAPPEVRRVTAEDLGPGVVAAVLALQAELGDAGIAVVAPASTVGTVVAALEREGVPFGLASRSGLTADITVVPVELAKGLELDGVVLVEPAKVVAEERQGLRALYVALTRPRPAPSAPAPSARAGARNLPPNLHGQAGQPCDVRLP
jgi:DNA helicase IV